MRNRPECHVRLTAPPCLEVYADLVPAAHPIRTAETIDASLAILVDRFAEGDPDFHYLKVIHRVRFVIGTRAPLRPRAIASLRRRPPAELIAALYAALDVDDAIAIIHRAQGLDPKAIGLLEPLIEILCRRFPHYKPAPERPWP
jgi:hypothetical protein